jgi:hypothetical protein
MHASSPWAEVSPSATPRRLSRHGVRERAQSWALRWQQWRLARTFRSGLLDAVDRLDLTTNDRPPEVPHFDRDRRELLALVRTAFTASRIEWHEEVRPWAERPRWHVDAEPWTVWQALRRGSRSDPGLDIEVRPRSRATPADRTRSRWLTRLLTREFTEIHLSDPRLGVVVSLSDPCPAGDQWLLSRTADRDDLMRSRLAVEAGLDLSFGTRPRVTAVIDFPVDLVYTWVDAGDPLWQDDRLAHPPGGDLVAAADVEARFVQSDELRYSLRSVEQFAPWVHRIWVVTSGQRPDWLLEHPKVTLVTHKEIWPDPSELPVFNSHAIEANLHRIPGLADRYLYLNDDMFLGRPVSPETFFTADGRPRVFPSRYVVADGPPVATDRAPDAAGKNNRDLVRLLTGQSVSMKFQHAPYAISRELVHELESRVPEIFRRTSSARYRSVTDVTVSGGLHHSYGLATGQVVASDLRYRYVDLDKDSRSRALRTIADTRYAEAFCLNAVESAPPGDEVLALLNGYFPYPAEWERPDWDPEPTGYQSTPVASGRRFADSLSPRH